jgi:hypothetical protein
MNHFHGQGVALWPFQVTYNTGHYTLYNYRPLGAVGFAFG